MTQRYSCHDLEEIKQIKDCALVEIKDVTALFI